MNQIPFGFRIGHWTDRQAITGCTVILCPSATVGGCDIRGSSPGSRELALLASEKTMQQVNAVLLTGGSAFGLAAADGVMRYLEEHDIGYETPWARVPIVPAAVIFDLNIGSNTVRPDASSGYKSCTEAVSENVEEGNVGAGTGATVGKWSGIENRMKGGLGTASAEIGDLVVSAIVVVNAVGDILGRDGTILAGARGKVKDWFADEDPQRRLLRSRKPELSNTTLAVIMTNARLSKTEVNRIAQRGHNGMARAIRPVHTSYDGDIVFALASGYVATEIDIVAELGCDVIEDAIRSGINNAVDLGGVPARGGTGGNR